MATTILSLKLAHLQLISLLKCPLNMLINLKSLKTDFAQNSFIQLEGLGYHSNKVFFSKHWHQNISYPHSLLKAYIKTDKKLCKMLKQQNIIKMHWFSLVAMAILVAM